MNPFGLASFLSMWQYGEPALQLMKVVLLALLAVVLLLREDYLTSFIVTIKYENVFRAFRTILGI